MCIPLNNNILVVNSDETKKLWHVQSMKSEHFEERYKKLSELLWKLWKPKFRFPSFIWLPFVQQQQGMHVWVFFRPNILSRSLWLSWHQLHVRTHLETHCRPTSKVFKGYLLFEQPVDYHINQAKSSISPKKTSQNIWRFADVWKCNQHNLPDSPPEYWDIKPACICNRESSQFHFYYVYYWQ